MLSAVVQMTLSAVVHINLSAEVHTSLSAEVHISLSAEVHISLSAEVHISLSAVVQMNLSAVVQASLPAVCQISLSPDTRGKVQFVLILKCPRQQIHVHPESPRLRNRGQPRQRVLRHQRRILFQPRAVMQFKGARCWTVSIYLVKRQA